MQQEETNEPLTKEFNINYSINNQKIELDLYRVNNLFNDIDKYNKSFSMGSMLARIITSRFEAIEESKPNPPLSQEESNQQINAFFLLSSHKSTLKKIGLSLEPVSGKLGFITDEETIADTGEVRINVENRDIFISFLGALDKTKVESSGLKRHLENLPTELSKQINDGYNLLSPNNELIELFNGMENIIGQYKRLGMESSVDKLKIYLEHAKKGDLKEYVFIDNKKYLDKTDKYFGPSKWQKDSGTENLVQRWQEAITILELTRDNPNAQELYKELKDQLKTSVNFAINDLNGISYYKKETIETLANILKEAKEKLNQI